MTVYRLTDENVFPPPELADDDGLLAVGGDLSASRLLMAYRNGIFPWYSDTTPILWWSPDPRLVLFPKDLKVSRSLRQTIRKGTYRVSADEAFDEVIRMCSDVKRSREEGTWITEEMIDAYGNLHRLGFAHSAESWHDGKLVGGLYGVSLGSVFFGESMFSIMRDSSKAAFATLVEHLKCSGTTVIDCQMTTAHLVSFGAREISRTSFLELLSQGLGEPTLRGRWSLDGDRIVIRHDEPRNY